MIHRPLRVCILGDSRSIHTQRWVAGLVRLGLDVHVITLRPEGPPLPGVHVVSLRPEGDGVVAGVERRLGGMGHLPDWTMRLGNLLRYRRAGLARAVAEINPDVLHAHYVTDYGLVAADAGFHPLVITAWGSDILSVARRSRLTRSLVRRALRQADAITCDADVVADEVRSLSGPGPRIELIYFGLEQSLLEAEHANDRRVVISARRLEPLYNTEQILAAWREIQPQLPGWALRVAGEGSQRGRLEQEVRTADMRGVEFLGPLTQPDLWLEMGRAKVFVSIPSWDASSASLHEAMALGCYPVVSDLPANREWIEDGINGEVVGQGGLASGLLRATAAATDESTGAGYRQDNLRRVKSVGTFDENMSRVLRLYTDLAAG